MYIKYDTPVFAAVLISGVVVFVTNVFKMEVFLKHKLQQ